MYLQVRIKENQCFLFRSATLDSEKNIYTVFPGEKYILLLYAIHFRANQVDLGGKQRAEDYVLLWLSFMLSYMYSKLHHTQNLERQQFLKGFST